MTQSQKILSHLKAGRTLTPLQALRSFGTFRLASRILELRQAGYRIQCALHKTKGGARVGLYWMQS
jgi:Helix-turn-helix domain